MMTTIRDFLPRGLAFGLFATTLAACGDGGGGMQEADASVPAVYGAYRVTELSLRSPGEGEQPPFTGDAKWVHVQTDDTFAVLSETGTHGFRDSRAGVVLVGERQIVFDSKLYNYTIAADTLTLTRPDESVTLVRDETAPAIGTWIVDAVELAEPLRLSPEIDASTDMAWDGSGFWIGNGESDTLRKIAADTGAILTTAPTTRSVNGVAWDGANLWLSNNGHSTVAKVSLTDTVLSTSPTLGAWIEGIAWDGAKIWALSNNENTLYAFTPGAASVSDEIPLRDLQYPNAALEYAGGFLFFAAGDRIIKCAVSPFAVVTTYRYTGFYIGGIGHDGMGFYLLGKVYDGADADEIVRLARVSLP